MRFRSKTTGPLALLAVPMLGLILLFQDCSSMSASKFEDSSMAAGFNFCQNNPADPSCVQAAEVSCSFNGAAIANGQSVMAYLNSSASTMLEC